MVVLIFETDETSVDNERFVVRECDYGVWTRRPNVEIDTERARRIFEPFPDDESYAQVAGRTRDLLGEVVREWAGKRVLIVGHRATWDSLGERDQRPGSSRGHIWPVALAASLDLPLERLTRDGTAF